MLLGDTFKECIPMNLYLKMSPSNVGIVVCCFPKDTSCQTISRLIILRQLPISVRTVP